MLESGFAACCVAHSDSSRTAENCHVNENEVSIQTAVAILFDL